MNGRDGKPGKPGAEGPVGPTESEGGSGLPGQTGEKGAAGPPLVPGPKGDQGLTGPSGGGVTYIRWGQTACPEAIPHVLGNIWIVLCVLAERCTFTLSITKLKNNELATSCTCR